MYRHYLQQLEEQKITLDPAQEAVLHRLYLLRVSLLAFLQAKRKRKLLRFLVGKRKMNAPRGIYLYGEVGRGKSMMMDLFFNEIPLSKKRRVHFHAFMLEIHAKLHQKRQKPGVQQANYLAEIAAEIAKECQLLCFDEFQVHDIADAMILGKLLKELIARHVVLVVTSNLPPDKLYWNGLQREHFLSCIQLIHQKLLVLEILSPHDYRKRHLPSLQSVYFIPSQEQGALPSLESIMYQLDPDYSFSPKTLIIQNRVLHLNHTYHGIVACTFTELCEMPLGAVDYLTLCEMFHTFIITEIPQLTPEMRNEAKRFITLIDTLYEHQHLLICTAKVPPEALYPTGDGASAFERTVSRLIEMQSQPYLKRHSYLQKTKSTS